jgi:serine phosphatase RsbU (regulator of sigma subunit)
VKQAGGSFELLKDRHGLVIGAMEMARYREYELQLEPGTKLFVYTDGLAEAANTRNELFGTERMIKVLQGAEEGTPEKILAAVNEAVTAFSGSAPQFDDLTMLCLSYRPA